MSSLRDLRLAAGVCAAFFDVLLPAGGALGAPGGEIDPAFGDNGLVHISDGHHGVAVMQQPADGKLLVAGDFPDSAGVTTFGVVRMNPDGTLDRSFGAQGLATIDFGGVASQAMAMELQPDGGIVVAGVALVDPPQFRHVIALARLDTVGQLDPTFGNGGLVFAQGPGGRQIGVRAIRRADNGQLVVVGTAFGGLVDDVLIARFNSNGSLDTAFGAGIDPGMTIVNTDQWADPVTAFLQPDGKIVVCGTDYGWWEAPSQMFVVRANADGSLDATFGEVGNWHLPLEDPYGDSSVGSCVLTSDGAIVLAGRAAGYAPGIVLLQLRSDGALDTAVWDSGLSAVGFDLGESVQEIVTLADGDFVIGGVTNVSVAYGPAGQSGPTSHPSFPVSDVYIALIDSQSGTFDPAFGNGGVTVADFGSLDLATRASVGGLIEQADGKLVAVATLWHQDALDPYWTAEDYERLSAIGVARVDPAGSGHAGFVGFAEPYRDISESDGVVVLPVRRTGGGTGSALVDYSTQNVTAVSPLDYTASSGTLAWSDGDLEPKLISVPITSDQSAEGEETFRVVLSNATTSVAGTVATVWVEDSGSSSLPAGGAGGASAVGAGNSGGGAFGLEVLLLLLVCAGCRRLSQGRSVGTLPAAPIRFLEAGAACKERFKPRVVAK
ncbi:MAG: Calx-beta domain-containing protein [Gammaproteobacteria bacterium]|jgi:uncharacterized delta-60 repeat protein